MAQLANGSNVAMTIGGAEGVDLSPVLKGLPDFAENKEQVETTVLKSMVKTYIAGLKDYGSLEFTCNYDKTIAGEVRELAGQGGEVSITLSDGTTISYTASDVSLTINAASSGALMEMTVVTFLDSDIEYDKAKGE